MSEGIIIALVAASPAFVKMFYDIIKSLLKRDGLSDVKRSLYRLEVYNTKLSPQDRDLAFRMYKRLGGNGSVDIYYRKNVVPLLEASVPTDGEQVN